MQANTFCLMICLQNMISVPSIFNKLLHGAEECQLHAQELYLVNPLPSSTKSKKSISHFYGFIYVGTCGELA